MPWHTSSSNGAWTPQQRAFIAAAVLLCILALAICVVRLQSDSPPAGGNRDGAGPVVSHANG